MDLVGLVVAGERVHHDVDAPAEGHLALALVEVAFAAAVSRRRAEALGPRQFAGMALIVAGVGWLLWTAR